MTDLEMVKKCAEAMGLKVREGWVDRDFSGEFTEIISLDDTDETYNPLTDDAQAMALVKKLKIDVGYCYGWSAKIYGEHGLASGVFHRTDLNRAIVECVAKLTSSTP